MNDNQETRSLRIDHRHLAFFFVGVVAVCGVFFALGFVVGRAQAFEAALREPESSRDSLEAQPAVSGLAGPAGEEGAASGTAEPSNASDPATGAGSDYRKDLDFYETLKDPKVDQNFHPESDKPKKAVPPAGKEKERGSGSLVSLQIAALKSSAEADKLAKALRAKGYPVFIVNPSNEDPNRLIRVQIGPYTSDSEAAKVKARLGSDGYTAITKK